jgi:hypothetical protein
MGAKSLRQTRSVLVERYHALNVVLSECGWIRMTNREIPAND